MRLPAALHWTVVLAILNACGSVVEQEAASLPPIPEIRSESFPTGIRTEIDARFQAAQAAPDDAEAAGRLAMLLQAHEQLEQAEALYRRARALEPDALRWSYYLGAVQAGRGDAEGAVESLRTALEVDSDYKPAQRKLAEELTTLNRLDEAADIYKSLMEDDPTDASAHFGLGRVRALDGDTNEAIEHLGEAIRLVPDYGAAYYELSLAYRDAGMEEESAKSLELYEQRSGAPREHDPLMAAVQSLAQGAGDAIRRGVDLESQGDLAGAAAEHLRALEIDPSVVQAHVNLVSLYGRMGEPEKAERHYRQALEFNPGQADLHYNYGVLMFTRNRFAEARAAFEKAIEANPSYASAHNNLGQILEQEGRVPEAAEHYRAAVQAQPQYRLARFHLGRMLLAQQNPREAADQLRRVIEPRDEMTPQVLMALSVAHAQFGDRAGAIRRAEEALGAARQMGQSELARRIEADLAKLR